MKKLEIGKKYRVKSNSGEIDFDYEVLDIKDNKILYKVLENRTKLPFSNYCGIKMSNYNKNSQFVENSEELK